MDEKQIKDGISLMGQGMGYLTIAFLIITIIFLFSQVGKIATILEIGKTGPFIVVLSINYLFFRQIMDEYADIQEHKEEIQW